MTEQATHHTEQATPHDPAQNEPAQPLPEQQPLADEMPEQVVVSQDGPEQPASEPQPAADDRPTRSHAKNLRTAGASLALAGTLATVLIASSAKRTEERPAADAPDTRPHAGAPQSPGSSSETTTSPTTSEVAPPAELDWTRPIPVSEVEELFGLPEGSVGTDWRENNTQDDFPDSPVPRALFSETLHIPSKNTVTVSVYENNFVSALDVRPDHLTSDGGLDILSVPLIFGIQAQVGDKYVYVGAAGTTPEQKADFLDEVVKDWTEPVSQ